MATIQLLIGGATFFPSTSKEVRKKQALAGASIKDNSVTIDRVLAARMRNALMQEVQRLETMSIPDFRQMLSFQGIETAKFKDNAMMIFLQTEASILKSIALKLLRDDLVNAKTPIIISGNVSGAVSLAAKILGPTLVANYSSLSTSIWWECKSDCRIESIHFSDKKMQKVIKP